MTCHKYFSRFNNIALIHARMTSHQTASFQHGVQPGAGEGGPGAAEARYRRHPRLVLPQILAAYRDRTDSSPQADGAHWQGDRTG